MADNFEQQGQLAQVREVLQRAASVSPKSILRQKRLAHAAERAGELAGAISAQRAAVGLGEQSCHGCIEDNVNFARLAALKFARYNRHKC